MTSNTSTDQPTPFQSIPSTIALDGEPDQTIQQSLNGGNLFGQETTESCLVQIYPPDVVNGMSKLSSEPTVMGRDQSADYVLIDNSVSRRHAEIVHDGNGFMIRDLGSTNGTLVNGVRTTQQSLKSSDTIQIGSFLFRFLTAGSVESVYHETVYTALTRDALTGAMNRRYLIESLQREIVRASRHGETLVVAMIDIDHFKNVNDTHGHLVGDEVLSEFGHRIDEVCRDDDLFARFGGEEFCVVFSSTERAEALQILERCRNAIASQNFQTSIGEISITASFGFACVQPTQPMPANELLEVADSQLYHAKDTGRNKVCG